MLNIDFQDGSCGSNLGFSISSVSYFVSHKCPNAHHQVSNHLDYRDVQNMNSQHFSMYRAPTNALGRKFDLAIRRSNVNVAPSF